MTVLEREEKMSMNIVNNNHPGQKPAQEQSYSGRIIGSAAGAAVGTAAGVGYGYYLGGTTPTLDEVFTQEQDTFEESLKKMKNKNEEAAGKVADARTDLNNTVNKAKEALVEPQKAFDAKAAEQEVDKKYTEAVTNAQDELDKTKVKINETEEKDFSQLTEEQKNLDDVKKAVAEKQENLKKAEAELKEAQGKALREAAAQENAPEDVKKVVKNLDDAKKKVEDEITTARDKVATDDVKGAFKKVKRSLTEGKGKSMAIWGTIVGLAALTAGYFIGKSSDAKKNN